MSLTTNLICAKRKRGAEMGKIMKIAIGCDPNATDYKEILIPFIQSLGHECVDYGSDDPIYANTAVIVAEAVAAGQAERGILICGTGIGV